MGYSSVEGSYHAVTHAILISLIFTVIMCTMMIIEEIEKLTKANGGVYEANEDSTSDKKIAH